LLLAAGRLDAVLGVNFILRLLDCQTSRQLSWLSCSNPARSFRLAVGPCICRLSRQLIGHASVSLHSRSDLWSKTSAEIEEYHLVYLFRYRRAPPPFRSLLSTLHLCS